MTPTDHPTTNNAMTASPTVWNGKSIIGVATSSDNDELTCTNTLGPHPNPEFSVKRDFAHNVSIQFLGFYGIFVSSETNLTEILTSDEPEAILARETYLGWKCEGSNFTMSLYGDHTCTEPFNTTQDLSVFNFTFTDNACALTDEMWSFVSCDSTVTVPSVSPTRSPIAPVLLNASNASVMLIYSILLCTMITMIIIF